MTVSDGVDPSQKGGGRSRLGSSLNPSLIYFLFAIAYFLGNPA